MVRVLMCRPPSYALHLVTSGDGGVAAMVVRSFAPCSRHVVRLCGGDVRGPACVLRSIRSLQPSTPCGFSRCDIWRDTLVSSARSITCAFVSKRAWLRRELDLRRQRGLRSATGGTCRCCCVSPDGPTRNKPSQPPLSSQPSDLNNGFVIWFAPVDVVHRHLTRLQS